MSTAPRPNPVTNLHLGYALCPEVLIMDVLSHLLHVLHVGGDEHCAQLHKVTMSGVLHWKAIETSAIFT